MSLLYDSSFKYPEGELRKNQDDFTGPYLHNHQQNHHENSGSNRYRSGPSSFLESLFSDDGSSSNSGGANCGINYDDDRFVRSSSPEMEILFESYMSKCNGEKIKQETEIVSNGYGNGSEMVCGSNQMDGPFVVMNDIGSENRMQVKMGNTNGSTNLARQKSSPAGFLSNLGMNNGFNLMSDLGGLRNSNTANGEASSSASGLNGHMNLLYRPSSSNSSLMPQIAENVPVNVANFSRSWDETSLGVLNGAGENNIEFSRLNGLETQNANSKIRSNGLTHHLSLPTTFSERATMDKFLHFQGPVPCKIRARRGCATHPRSIAERVRRTRISERMRKLQELFPDMDKTSTADMLEKAVAHIKDLQKQVKALTDKKEKCTCAGKEKQHADLSA